MTKRNFGAIATTIIVALIPILLWLLSQPIQLNSLNDEINTFSKLLALAGFGLFGWNILLSTRLKVFEKLYGGLPNLYKWHHITGSWAFILLIIHPTLLAIRYATISFTSAYEFLKPSLNYPQLAAEATLGIMLVAIFVSLYVSIKHELFVKVQITLGLIFFLGAYHALYMSGSDVMQSLPLLIFGTVWVGSALMVILYRSLFHGSFRKRYTYTIGSMSHQADVLDIGLESDNGMATFAPGQFVFIKPINAGVKKEFHPFSITSAVSDKTTSVGIKQLGDFTNSLENLKLGDEVIVDGPYGEFGKELATHAKQVWIAGGIGITPFVAMAKAIQNQQVDLFYSIRSANQGYYVKQLVQISKLKPNFRLHIIDTEKQSQLTAGDVTSSCGPSTTVWICGPLLMMKALKTGLVQSGVPKQNIITEEFSLS